MPNISAELVKKIKSLPPVNSTLQEVLQMLGRNSSDWNSVARKVSQDPVLSGRVLHLANSSFYGHPRKIKDVESACMLLGANTVRNLVLTLVAMAQMREGRKGTDINYETLWKHNLLTACMMQTFAKLLKADAATAFTAGLFHSLGVIVEDFFFADLAIVDRKPENQNANAYALTETRHLEYCVALLTYWQFPSEIIDVFAGGEGNPARLHYRLMKFCCAGSGVDCLAHQREHWNDAWRQEAGQALGLQAEDIEHGIKVADALYQELAPLVLS